MAENIGGVHGGKPANHTSYNPLYASTFDPSGRSETLPPAHCGLQEVICTGMEDGFIEPLSIAMH